MVLNYKSIPYKTTFLEYPSVAPTFQSLGIPPNKEGTPYTIPTIRDATGKYIVDSRAIATELEKQYPEPSLHLDSPKLEKMEELFMKAITGLRAVFLPPVPRNLLREPSREYFERTREEKYGMPLARFEKEMGGDKAWEEARPYLNAIGDLLREEGGPFVLGETCEIESLPRTSLLVLHYFPFFFSFCTLSCKISEGD